MINFSIISCIFKDEINYDVKKCVIQSLINSNLNVIIFTNRETWEDYLKLSIVGCNKDNLRIFSKEYYQFFGYYTKIDWDVQRLLDKKEQVANHFSDYTQCIRNYLLCNQKLEFIYEVSQNDPFNSDYYIWTERLLTETEIQLENQVKTTLNKIVLCIDEQFHESEFELFQINNIPKIDYNATQFSRINDKVMIIKKDLLKEFHDHYYHLLLKLPRYKRFVGNSNFNMNYIYILYKGLFDLVNTSKLS